MTAESFPRVGPETLSSIADLCARAVTQTLTVSELGKALFSDDQPAIVRFRPGVGVVATVREGDDGYVRLLAVDPDARRQGHGHALVEAAEADLAGTRVITIGADPPYFLFPGVPVSETPLCYLLERHHFSREEANYNAVVDLAQVPVGPQVSQVPIASQRPEVEEWALEQWPHWKPEFMRAFDQGSLLLARDEDGISALCAYDVNRAATLGPIASRMDLMGKGAAKGLLLDALGRMRQRGYDLVEILWVSPLVPYVRVGAVIGPIFFVYRKRHLPGRPSSDPVSQF